MTRTLVVLAGLALLLHGIERAVSGDAGSSDAHGPELVRVGELAGASDAVVAGLSVSYPGIGSQYRYARSQGRWRCLSAWGAPCDGELVERLLRGLLGARGVVRARDGWSQATYGFAGAEAVELVLHGKRMLSDPAGDPIAGVRFGERSRVAGAAPESASGAFAQVLGVKSLLELELEPRALLGGDPRRGLPPLLDQRLVPLEFPGHGRRIDHAFLERSDAASLELVRRERAPSAPGPEVEPAQTLDWEWLLVQGAEQVVIPPLRGEAWVTFVLKAQYVGLADPREPEAHGLDVPAARLTLAPREGEPLVLSFGAATPDGGRWILHPSVPLLALVDAQTALMLLPAPEELRDDSRPNPWDRWLRAQLAQRWESEQNLAGGQRNQHLLPIAR